MPLIASEDYPNKRIFLGVDSVGVAIQPIDIYKEHRARRRINANGERDFLPMVFGLGNEQIGAEESTPRFTNLISGVKIVPYDTTQTLKVIGALISIDDQLKGADLFDRSSLLSTVDIDYNPPQVEILRISTGSGLSAEQDDRLTKLFNATTDGTGLTAFSIAALANAPAGGSTGSGVGVSQEVLDAIAAILAQTSYTAEQINAVNSKVNPITRLAKRFAAVDGVSTTYTNTSITSSDGDIDITLTDNGGGSYTATLN